MNVQASQEKTRDLKGVFVSGIIHSILFLFFIIYTFTNLIPDNPKTAEVFIEVEPLIEENVTLDANLPDQTENANIAENETSNGATAKANSIPESALHPTVKPSKNTSTVSPATTKITDNKSDIALAEAKAKTEKEKAESAARIAREEARIKAEREERERAEANKKKYTGLFGKKDGNGSGGNANSGSGDDPNAKSLDGLVTGNGKIGEGLVGRGVIKIPKINDKSQQAGKVVVRVCVDKSGKVIEAKFTQKGSTTTDSHLVKVAEEGARKYVFSSSENEKQCGTITIDFILN